VKKDTAFTLLIVLCSLAQVGLSGVLLNSLSNIDNWSAVYAEDSTGYLLAADYFRGSAVDAEDVPLLRYRLFSPAIPLLAALVGNMTGIPAAFLIINIVLWNLAALLFYRLLKTLLKDQLSALCGAVMLTTSLPVAQWGLPVMVDMGAYFCAGCVFFLYFWVKERRPPATVLYGVVIGFAVLTKPTLLSLLLFAGLCFLRDRAPLRGCVVVLAALGVIAGAYSLLGLSIADFTPYGVPRHRGIVYLVSAAFFCFHWGWYFLFIGWRQQRSYTGVYMLYLIAFGVPYVLFVHNPRLFFLSYPAVIPCIVAGIRQVFPSARRTLWAVAAYAVTSNIVTVLHLYVMRTLKVRDVESLQAVIFSFFGMS